MSASRSGLLDPVFRRGGAASPKGKRISLVLGTKVALFLNEAHPSFMNSVTGSTCRAKCSNILHDSIYILKRILYVWQCCSLSYTVKTYNFCFKSTHFNIKTSYPHWYFKQYFDQSSSKSCVMQFYSLPPTVLNRLESLKYCFVLKKGHFNLQGIKIGLSKSGLSNKATKNFFLYRCQKCLIGQSVQFYIFYLKNNW
jgi:hypothetical protein